MWAYSTSSLRAVITFKSQAYRLSRSVVESVVSLDAVDSESDQIGEIGESGDMKRLVIDELLSESGTESEVELELLLSIS